MRHRKAGLKLGRTSSHRNAMFRNMVTSLFKYDRIQTTDAKAKELRRWADRLITLAKKGDLHARRRALSIVREKDVVHKLFEDAGKRFGAVQGGYTRIVKIGRRPGDAAPVSLVELIAAEPKEKKKKPARKDKSSAKKTEGKKAAAEEKAPAQDPETAAGEKAADPGDVEEAGKSEEQSAAAVVDESRAGEEAAPAEAKKDAQKEDR